MQNFTKTIINAVQNWTKKEIKNSASDWSQNDASAASYVKNRTHYITPDAVSIPPTHVNVNGMGYTYCVGQFEEGKTYNVVFDGITYPCVWEFFAPSYYNEAYMGNGSIVYDDWFEDTGEPFLFRAISYYGFPVYSIKFKENGTHTVGIEGYFEPISITITDGNSHGFGPALVSGNTYKVKWNGAEYILTAFTIDDSDGVLLGNSNLLNYAPPSSEKNEPFCFNYSPFFGMLSIQTSEKQENTFSIEGILPEQTRKFNIELSYQFMTDIDTAWQLSLEENKEYTVILDGEEYNCICKYNYDSEDLYIGSEKLFYPLKTIDDYPFVITPEGFCTVKGAHEISIREDSATKIDKKFLPPLVGKKNSRVKGAEVFNDYSYNIASGKYSHAEGARTFALGESSHAEGYYTAAFGNYSHAEGLQTNASGDYSHAEGNNTTASGSYSHAEGISTKASGRYSHTEGNNTKASSNYQHVQGRHNIEDTEDKYAHIVGNGNSSKSSNSHTLDWEGNAWYQGDVYVGSTSGTNKDDGSKKLATEEYVTTKLGQEIYKQPEEPTDAPEGALWVDTDQESGSSGSGGGVTSWNDLTDKPELFSGSYNDLTDKPELFSGSWNDLTDKPFESVSSGDTLVIDYDPDNIDPDKMDSGGVGFLKVSDSIVTIEDLANGITYKSLNGESTELTADDVNATTYSYADGMLYNGRLGICFIEEKAVGVDCIGTTFPESGLYITAGRHSAGDSIYIPGYNFESIKTIDAKYLPKHLAFGEHISHSSTLFWDGDTTDLAYMETEFGGRFFKVSDLTPSVEDIESYKLTFYAGPTFDSESNPVYVEESGAILLGHTEGNGEHHYYVIILPHDDTGYGPKGIYFGTIYGTYVYSLTIPSYIFENKVIKTINAKYMPKYLQLREYIVEADTLTWDGNISGLESGYLSHFKVSDSVPTEEDLVNGYEITFNNNSNTITNIEDPIYTDEEGFIYLGNTSGPGCPLVIISLYDSESNSKGIYFFYHPSFPRIESLKIPGYTFEVKESKLDKKYIPDSMPEVTAEDNGKFLRVVDGVWAAASIPTAEEVGALTEAQVTIMINNALGVIENGAY